MLVRAGCAGPGPRQARVRLSSGGRRRRDEQASAAHAGWGRACNTGGESAPQLTRAPPSAGDRPERPQPAEAEGRSARGGGACGGAATCKL